MDEELLRRAEAMIPFNRLLGLELEEVGDGYVRTRLPFKEELIGDVWRPTIHGGAISGLVDATGGLAGFGAITNDDRISTVDQRVDYLRPAQPADLIAEAKVVRTGNRVCVVSVEIRQPGSDEIVAKGQCVFNIRRGGGGYEIPES